MSPEWASPQCSCLGNPMDGGAWQAAVHGVTNSQTRLSDFTFTFHFHALEKAMATHSSVLAWRIPGTGEPGGLPSMGWHRVGHDWRDLAAAAVSESGYFNVLLICMSHTLYIYIYIYITYHLYIYYMHICICIVVVFFATPCGMWDCGSLTRD